MKKALLTILTLLAMAGCNGCGFAKPEGQTTHKYDPYFQQFNRDLVSLGHSPIDFSELEIRESEGMADGSKPIMAHCYSIERKSSGPSAITFDKKMDSLPEICRQVVTSHEIGHCYFGFSGDHNTGVRLMTAGDLCSAVLSLSNGNPAVNEAIRLQLIKEMIQ